MAPPPLPPLPPSIDTDEGEKRGCATLYSILTVAGTATADNICFQKTETDKIDDPTFD